MPKKFSHFIFIITFILSLLIILPLSILSVNSHYQETILKLKEQGTIQLQNQMTQIDNSLAIITNYSRSLAKATQASTPYDEKTISALFNNLFLKEVGVFQLRLLTIEGMELVRYDLNKQNKIVKSHSLQNKSTRYYIQEARSLHVGEVYISKLDLNKENGQIEIPYKKTIRVVQKVIIQDKLYYLVINYDLTTILKTALNTTLYNLFFVEKDGQINMHLDDTYAFSAQQYKNLFWYDFIETKEEFISQKSLKSLQYDVVISLKKSELHTLKAKKSDVLQKMIIIALLISFTISALLYYFLKKYLTKLSTNVLYKMQNKKINSPVYFQEFKDIVDKVERQQHIIQKNLQALNMQKEFTHSIINSQSNFILITDGKELKDTNKTMLDFFDYPSLEAFNNAHDCICDFFIPEEGYLVKEKHGKTWLDIVLGDINKVQKVMMKNSDGERHIFQIYTRKLHANEKNFVLSLTDVTELTTLQTSLEDKVAQQVNELREKEQQLMQQSRLAQMGEMISMIAHQWRQPLTAISATTGNLSFKLMMDDINKKEFEEEISLIEGYAQHLSKTIDDFRSFFKQDKEKEMVSLDEIVKSTLNIAKVSAEDKSITIKTILNAEKKIETFSGELKQVLLNLIKNAEDALLENEVENPTIMIETSSHTNTYLLRVKDNAGGIPNEIMKKIFNPYFSTKKEKDGTGLGLYMSKTIIEEHCEGKLDVENDKDGAVFTITFDKVLS